MQKYNKAVIVDSDSGRRAELSRMLFDLGIHPEPYESFAELDRFVNSADVMFAYDEDDFSVDRVFETMSERRIWLSTVIYSENIDPARVVDATCAGASDYFSWPIDPARLRSRVFQRNREEILSRLRRRILQAQRTVSNLTQRESQVLLGLLRGGSNKNIAKNLRISPRTVEIHRANMMAKLKATNVTKAVEVAIFANLDDELDRD